MQVITKLYRLCRRGRSVPLRFKSCCLRRGEARELSNAGKIGYVTDIEGDRFFWANYLKISKIFDVKFQDEQVVDVRLKPGCIFVMGGDVNDQMDGDIFVVEQLLQLKRRYPDRVHFILGNRDTNKLRLIQELSKFHMEKHDFHQYPGTFWTKLFFKHSPRETLKQLGITAPASEHDSVERLKWILACTMGSADAFELRRLELQRRLKRLTITDYEVFCSFVDNLKPGGIFAEYLQAGSLALILNDTLFVHGGLDDSCLGFSPDHPDFVETRLQTWVDGLNAFAKRDISRCIKYGSEDMNENGDVWAMRGGYLDGSMWNIVQYGMGWLPNRDRNRTIVYRDWRGDKDLLASLPSPSVIQTLMNNGINKIITGHKPDGDAPLVLSNDRNNFHVIAADTSYSGDTKWLSRNSESSDDPGKLMHTNTRRCASSKNQIDPKQRHLQRRGEAVSEILIDRKTSNVLIHGRLSSGDKFEASVGETGDPLIGKNIEGNKFIKCERVKDKKLIVSHAVKWDVYNEVYDRNELY